MVVATLVVVILKDWVEGVGIEARCGWYGQGAPDLGPCATLL